MALADILKTVGEDVAKGAAAAGKAAVPILQRTAEVVSGEAPEIDAEDRRRAEALEDAQINEKSAILEHQLSDGQKYGTLTPDQQQQYIDAITGLYNKPRHAQVLMQKLQKAIHPQGAHAMGPQAPLASPTPQGGTLRADVDASLGKKGVKPVPGVHPFKAPDGQYYQPMYDSMGQVVNEPVPGYEPPQQKGAGKSPPLAGNMLPSDAVGPDGNPIPEAERNAGKSFVQYQGAWWPVAKPKPVFKTVKGHSVLVDSQSGAILRDLGPAGTAKVTSRQSLQPGDDGQMHVVTLTSVTTPEGATIDVQPEEDPTAQTPAAQQPGAAPKPKGVGSVLPRQPSTGARKVTPPGAGPVVPGLSSMAANKLRTPAEKKADNDVVEATKLAAVADQVAKQPNDAVNQKRLAVALERMSAGRFTTQALAYVIKAGWGNTMEQWANNPTTGALPADVMRQLIDGAHENLKAAQIAQRAAYGGSADTTQTQGGDDIDAIVQALKGKR